MDREGGFEGGRGARIEREPRDPYSISEMPDKETLEAFLRGKSGEVTVYFDILTGKFVRKTNDKA